MLLRVSCKTCVKAGSAMSAKAAAVCKMVWWACEPDAACAGDEFMAFPCAESMEHSPALLCVNNIRPVFWLGVA